MDQQNSVDDKTRQIIREELDTNIYVEAGAGTGKTTSLVDRVVSLILSGVKVENIIAITFTRAAASELKSRIREGLEDELESNTSLTKQQRANVNDAKLNVESAAFQTIDSLALSMLNEFPFEAGLPPGATNQDDYRAEQRFEELWQLWLAERFDGDKDFEDFIRRALFYRLRNPIRSLRQLAACQFSAPVPIIRTDGDEILRSVSDAAGQVRSAMDDCTDPEDKLYIWMKAAIGWYDDAKPKFGDTSEENVVNVLLSFTDPGKTNVGTKANWGESPKAQRGNCNDLREKIAEGRQCYRDRVAADMARFAFSFVDLFHQHCEEEATLTFDQTLSLAVRMLESSERTLRRVQARYTHVLVDEFQDTSPEQVRFVQLLTTPPGETSAKPGSLFVVGDPKQSIYRFRGADAEISNNMAAEIETNGRNEPLRVNHRSLKPIVEWVNFVFGVWFEKEIDDKAFQQAKWTPLEVGPDATRANQDVGAVYHFGEPVDLTAEPLREFEAGQLAQILLSVCKGAVQVRDETDASKSRPSCAGDIVILTRSRSSWEQIKRALTEFHIPLTIEREGKNVDPQEFRDLLNCLTAIDDPMNEPATVGALRSVYFGCSDIELQDWASNGGKFGCLQRAPEGLQDSKIADALATLRRYHDRKSRVAVPVLMEELIRECKVREQAYFYDDTETILRRIDLVLDLARDFEQAETTASLRDWTLYLREYRTHLAEIREVPSSSNYTDAVRLMTMHNSKGLQFPIVFIVDLGHRGRNDTDMLKKRTNPQSFEVEYAIRIGNGDDKYFYLNDYQAMQEADKAANQLEEARVMYVAATRARDALFVSRFRQDSNEQTLAKQLDDIINDESDLWQPIPDEWLEPGQATMISELPETLDVELDDREAWQIDHRNVLDDAANRGWVSPSRIAHESDAASIGPKPDHYASATDEFAVSQRGRAPTAIGSAVHSAVQKAIERADANINEVATNEADAHNIPEFADEIANLTRATLQMPLVKSVTSKADGGYWLESQIVALIDCDNGSSQVIEGRIDLIYQLPDGTLGIADFKTDREFDRTIDEMAEPYVAQLGAYAYAVQKTTGLRVSEAYIFFSRLSLSDPKSGEFRIDDIDAAIDLALELVAHESE